MKRIAIIGGGISGLATAYRLSRSRPGREGKLEIRLCEANDRLGGVIQTEKRNGFLMERGPDSFISTKPWAVEFCRELGLEKDFTEPNPGARQSFILSQDRLIPVPRGFYLMAPTKVGEAMRTPLLNFAGKIRMACEWFIPPKKTEGDESLAGFVRRRFGRQTLERIARPMIAGLYTTNPEELSAEATFPHFLQMEREYGSVIRALVRRKAAVACKAGGPRYGLFLTLKEGFGSLISTLIARMSQLHFHLSTKIVRLEKKSSWRILSERGEVFEADIVCLAMPASSAAKLLDDTADDIAGKLREIPCETVSTVNLAFHRRHIVCSLNGSDYRVPDAEKTKAARGAFSNIKISGRAQNSETILLRAFLGGEASRELLESDDEKVARTVCGNVRNRLGISAEPVAIVMSRWPASLPQYRVGHRQKVERIFAALRNISGLHLTGNAYEGTGIPDCIRHAFQTADQILAGLEDPVKTERFR